MPEVTVKREELTRALLDEASAVVARNQAETGGLPDRPIVLETETYLAMEKMGFLRAHVCRVGGRLVGYSLMFLRKSLHTGDLVAMQDSLYVEPEYRGTCGVRLVKESDRLLAGEGVVAIYRQSTTSRDISRLLKRFGYAERETVYARRFMRGESDGN